MSDWRKRVGGTPFRPREMPGASDGYATKTWNRSQAMAGCPPSGYHRASPLNLATGPDQKLGLSGIVVAQLRSPPPVLSAQRSRRSSTGATVDATALRCSRSRQSATRTMAAQHRQWDNARAENGCPWFDPINQPISAGQFGVPLAGFSHCAVAVGNL